MQAGLAGLGVFSLRIGMQRNVTIEARPVGNAGGFVTEKCGEPGNFCRG